LASDLSRINLARVNELEPNFDRRTFSGTSGTKVDDRSYRNPITVSGFQSRRWQAWGNAPTNANERSSKPRNDNRFLSPPDPQFASI